MRLFPVGWIRLFGVTTLAGVLVGAGISVLAYYVARYGPRADSWSFQGNGALAVYTLLPAALAAGWTALVLDARSDRSWLTFGLAAGLVGTLLAAADAALLPIFGPGADRSAGPFLLLALLAWMVLAPVLALFRWGATESRIASVPRYVGAGVTWFAATITGLLVAGVIAPAGS